MSHLITKDSLRGVFPALVTPFTPDGSSINFKDLSKLLQFHLSAGVSGIVMAGSTGEAATLEDEEYRSLLEATIKEVGGRIPVIAGVNSNSLSKSKKIIKIAEESRADGLLVVVPFYNKPSQEGIFEYFAAAKELTSLPVIAYNVPGRTVTNLAPETVFRLVDKKIIVGLKEASGSMDQMLEIVRLCGDKLALLSGEDSLFYSCLAIGGAGIISATANIIPEHFVAIHKSYINGDNKGSLAAQLNILPLIGSMFMESNPVPVKAALAMRGIITSNSVRLPLIAASDKTRARLSELFNS
jgi:4-hydroxy-tetrahydrodipicolinate synthase